MTSLHLNTSNTRMDGNEMVIEMKLDRGIEYGEYKEVLDLCALYRVDILDYLPIDDSPLAVILHREQFTDASVPMLDMIRVLLTTHTGDLRINEKKAHALEVLSYVMRCDKIPPDNIFNIGSRSSVTGT